MFVKQWSYVHILAPSNHSKRNQINAWITRNTPSLPGLTFWQVLIITSLYWSVQRCATTILCRTVASVYTSPPPPSPFPPPDLTFWQVLIITSLYWSVQRCATTILCRTVASVHTSKSRCISGLFSTVKASNNWKRKQEVFSETVTLVLCT